ncbi:MAG: phosphatidate cytidylyltransferase [Verrucomicrobiota bacterium]|nr:phosphatidate cytidylyltransferase [Verrucomicrobiota bacterium]
MPDASDAQPSSSKATAFFRRVTTSLVLWTVVIGVLFFENPTVSRGAFIFLILFLALAGLIEFYELAEMRGLACFKWSGLLGAVLLTVGTYLNLTGRLGLSDSPARVNDFETGFIILFVLGLCVRMFVSKSNHRMSAIAITLFGLMYVPWLLNFFQKIYFFPRVDGKYFLLYFVLLTKFSDMGAYAIGSVIGRHKMVPRISPHKTWEGFAGSILVATGASLAFVRLFGAHMDGMNAFHAVILGVVLGGTAVVGDLVESLFKREAGAKDSGGLFPGIGGILDLLDSLLFNAPIMYLYLRHVLTD